MFRGVSRAEKSEELPPAAGLGRATVFSGGFAACFSGAAASSRPNILFLFADDQRADTIGAWGNPHIRTPALDKLARDGCSFRRNYIFGGDRGAVCMPSRAMLMSGRALVPCGHPEAQRRQADARVAPGNGYVTSGRASGTTARNPGCGRFSRASAVMFGGMSDHSRAFRFDLGPDGKLTGRVTGEKFSSELFADSAIAFLRQHDAAGRFSCRALPPRTIPGCRPARLQDYYYRHQPPLPANFLPQFPSTTATCSSAG